MQNDKYYFSVVLSCGVVWCNGHCSVLPLDTQVMLVVINRHNYTIVIFELFTAVSMMMMMCHSAYAMMTVTAMCGIR